MPQRIREFADNLNKHLDSLGMPANCKERAAVFSKMLHISKQQAWELIDGHILPDTNLLQQIATELEINPEELLNN